MRKFGLIGKSLDHSWSKEYFTGKFKELQLTDCLFDNYLLSSLAGLRELITHDETISGLNITLPYKQDIIRYLDEIEPDAERAGAVNCIKISRQGNTVGLKGFNTDIPAFRESIKPLLTSRLNTALVLGTGGAAKAVAYALKELQIGFRFVSRTTRPGCITYEEIDPELIQSSTIIINATPAGMFPEINNSPPLPYSYLTSYHLLFDLVYNPEETLFLRKGKEYGAQTKNGLEMLRLQAELSWGIWTSPPGPLSNWRGGIGGRG